MAKQLENRNYLSPIGFKFILDHAPKVDFTCNRVNLPGINFGVAVQSNYLKMIDHPGDHLVYEDLSIDFLIDENMENYLEIYNWMIGLGYPETVQQFSDVQNKFMKDPQNEDFPEQSEATLIILNSNYQPSFKIKYRGVFPIALTPLEFDARERDYNYFTSRVTFKYTMFNIYDRFDKRIDKYDA